jgi:hypothetical protein
MGWLLPAKKVFRTLFTCRSEAKAVVDLDTRTRRMKGFVNNIVMFHNQLTMEVFPRSEGE